MNYKDLNKILQKLIFFITVSFIILILIINILKITFYFLEIKEMIKKALNNDSEINVINSDINKIKLKDNKIFNLNKAYTAEDLGFENALYNLNGSEWGDGINILLIGSDKNKNVDVKSRADVIIILRIINTGKILSISIPRDSLIKIQDEKWKGKKDKINHSYYWGGFDNLKKDIEHLLSSPIDKVLIIENLRNFEIFLAIIGGIKIDKNLHGSLGIQWIRNRNFKDGDIDRCKRHQVFLKKAIIKTWKITRNGNYFLSNLMYDNLIKIVKTDLSKDDFLKILNLLKMNNFNPENYFLTSILPGTFGKYDSVLIKRKNVDCWILDEEILNKMQFLFYSENNNEDLIVKKNKILSLKIQNNIIR